MNPTILDGWTDGTVVPSDRELDVADLQSDTDVLLRQVLDELREIRTHLQGVEQHVSRLDAFTAAVQQQLAPVIDKIAAGGISSVLFGRKPRG